MFGKEKPHIHEIKRELTQDSNYVVSLKTNRGVVSCRYYPVVNTRCAAIWVGGVGGSQGGWASPAQGLYPQLCKELTEVDIASLWIRYRHEKLLPEAVFDVLTGIQYLETEGIEQIGLVGHSFGGAVVIQSAAIADSVCTVVTLATQRAGTDCVDTLSPRCSILLLHGKVDKVLLPWSSETVYQMAYKPKRLVLYNEADHNLVEVSDTVHITVKDWLIKNLG